MNPSDIPPILEGYLPEPPATVPPPKPKWRWAVHTALLISYVLAIGLLGAFFRDPVEGAGPIEAAMPKDLRALAIMCAVDFGFFAFIFALAWMFSRATFNDLFLKWRGCLRPLLLGLAYSIALRVGLLIVIVLVAIPFAAVKGEKEIDKMRPKIEAVVNIDALKDPAYFLFSATVLSFGLAGFREELWRAAVMAGFAGMVPSIFASRKGQYIAVIIAAFIFGLGHLPQGFGGVFLTAMLGIGLGVIIVRHQSIWEAILAHGFFDATTFALLFLVARFAPDALKSMGVGAN